MSRLHREPGKYESFIKGRSDHMSHVNIPVGNILSLNSEENRILAAFPFFGGTSVEPTTEEKKPAGTDPAKPGATTTTVETEDPIAKLQSDPNALRDLLNQVGKLTKDHETATNALGEIEKEKEKQARAQQSKEEQLQTDLDNANLTIERMNEVVRNVAKENSFLANSGDTKWNSVKQAMAELDENNYTIDVDLDAGSATVTGIDNEVKRIAKDFSWLVKSSGVIDPNDQQQQRGPGRPRQTGTPPAPPKGNEAKKDRRDKIMNRFPVLMQQR